MATNEQTNAVNELTEKNAFERTNKPDNRTSEMSARQTVNDQWREQTPTNPATQQWLKYTYPFWKRTKSAASLVQNIEKAFPAWLLRNQ